MEYSGLKPRGNQMLSLFIMCIILILASCVLYLYYHSVFSQVVRALLINSSNEKSSFIHYDTNMALDTLYIILAAFVLNLVLGVICQVIVRHTGLSIRTTLLAYSVIVSTMLVFIAYIVVNYANLIYGESSGVLP